MGDIHYFVEMPVEQYRYDRHIMIVTPELFRRIGDYTQSQPTSPSPGRIYKKNLHWSGPPTNWWVYLCEKSKMEGYVDHRPLRLVMSTDFDKMIDQYTPLMPFQISDRLMGRYRYLWDGRQRRWMRCENFTGPCDKGYNNVDRVNPRNHMVAEINKPIRDADVREMHKIMARLRRKWARERAWRARPMTHHERFERELETA